MSLLWRASGLTSWPDCGAGHNESCWKHVSAPRAPAFEAAAAHAQWIPSSTGFYEILTDQHGQPCDYRFLDINASFERLTGLKSKDVLGKRVS